ncbi:hypothetical protein VNO77_39139 [Canavalia gladiata]|uniref:Uncharacterized protein n=1 Tax=Canavalia gladiata TaxID=3824 RepID=A0AAN9KAK2_CANGL
MSREGGRNEGGRKAEDTEQEYKEEEKETSPSDWFLAQDSQYTHLPQHLFLKEGNCSIWRGPGVPCYTPPLDFGGETIGCQHKNIRKRHDLRYVGSRSGFSIKSWSCIGSILCASIWLGRADFSLVLGPSSTMVILFIQSLPHPSVTRIPCLFCYSGCRRNIPKISSSESCPSSNRSN